MGTSVASSKPILNHGSPDRDVYPHLHGNDGLSIHSKAAMQTICESGGKSSLDHEAEDVFFGRHINKISKPAPRISLKPSPLKRLTT